MSTSHGYHENGSVPLAVPPALLQSGRAALRRHLALHRSLLKPVEDHLTRFRCQLRALLPRFASRAAYYRHCKRRMFAALLPWWSGSRAALKAYVRRALRPHRRNVPLLAGVVHFSRIPVVLAVIAMGLVTAPAIAQPAGPHYVQQPGAANPLNGLEGKTGASRPAFVDIDNDGDQDVFGTTARGFLQFHENVGTASSAILEVRAGDENPLDGLNIGSFRSSVFFADIDADGDRDAFVADGNYAGLSRFLENAGTPTAPEFVEREAAANPLDGLFAYTAIHTLSFADIDDDGDLDLFAGSRSGTSSVRFYENTGSPTTAAFLERTELDNPFNGIVERSVYAGPALADFDGDGDFDITLVPSGYAYSGGHIRYYENTGDAAAPVFQRLLGAANPFAAVPVPGYNPSIAMADIDDDGDVDVFAGSGDGYGFLGYSGRQIEFFENTGSSAVPTFAEAFGAANPFTALESSYQIAQVLADLDGDGDLDLVAGAFFGAPRYFENTAGPNGPQFEERTGGDNPFNAIYYAFGVPALGDLDGDGDLDLLLGRSSGEVRYAINSGTATAPAFTLAPGDSNPFYGLNVGTSGAPTLADLDGDGDLDVAVALPDTVSRYFENTGTPAAPAFTERTGVDNPFALITLGYNAFFTFGDLDGDGDLDTFGSSSTTGVYVDDVQYFENVGTSSSPLFMLLAGADNPFGADVAAYRRSAALGDVDGDGDVDAVLSGSYAGTGNDFLYFENRGLTNVAMLSARDANANPLRDLNENYQFAVPVLADIDGDGDNDAFVGGLSGQIRFFENSGSATSPEFELRTGPESPVDVIGGTSYGGGLTLGDLDADGDLDLFFVDRLAYRVRFFRNTGTAAEPVFEEVFDADNPLGEITPYTLQFALADIDDDGDLDLFSAFDFFDKANAGKGAVSPFRFYENVGTPAAPAFTERTGVDNPLGELATGRYSAYLSFGDVDGDGDLDILVPGLGVGFAYGLDSTLQYIENTGTATTPAFALQEGEANPFDGIQTGLLSGVALSDTDGDGDLDLYVGRESGAVQFFENTDVVPPVLFEQRTGAANPFDGQPVGPAAQLAFVDIDDDGDQDVFFTELQGYGGVGEKVWSKGQTPTALVRYFENTGTALVPGFAERTGAANPFDGVALYSVLPSPAFADVDGDGDYDALLTNFLGTPEYFENTGTASAPIFNPVPIAESPVGDALGEGLARVQFVDADGDGDLDLFGWSLYSQSGVAYAENIGTPTAPDFMASADSPLGNLGVGTGLFGYLTFGFSTLHDLDGDGDLDVFYAGFGLYGGSGATRIHYAENLGTPEAGFFEDISGIANPFNGFATGTFSAPAFVDIDSDGDPDVFAGGPFTDEIRTTELLFVENVAGIGVEEPTLEEAADALLASFNVADLDQDGRLSLTEAQGLLAALPGAVFAALDLNSDGAVDATELDQIVNGPPCNNPDLDTDGDGLSDCDEDDEGTDPDNVDTDSDGMPDGFEVEFGLDPLDPDDAGEDKDGDGINNYEEFQDETDPADGSDPNPTIIVSPSGSDENEGTAASPLLTVGAALELHTMNGGGPIQLILEPGVYIGNFALNPEVRLIGRRNASGEIAVFIQGEVAGAANTQIEDIEFQSTVAGEVLLDINNSAMKIRRVRFMGMSGARNATGIDATGAGAGDALIESCEFTDLLVGVNILDGVPVIRKSLFLDPSMAGILVQETAMVEDGLSVSTDAASGFNTFNFQASGPNPVEEPVAVLNETDVTLRMENNDWGTNDPAEIDQLISGPKDFEPFLAQGSAILASSVIVTAWDKVDQKRLTTARVKLEGSSFDPITENDNGVYIFPVVEEGDYEVLTVNNGFTDLEVPASVPRGAIVPVSAAMTRATGGEGEGEGEGEPGKMPAACSAGGGTADTAYGDWLLLLCLLAILSGAALRPGKDADA